MCIDLPRFQTRRIKSRGKKGYEIKNGQSKRSIPICGGVVEEGWVLLGL